MTKARTCRKICVATGALPGSSSYETDIAEANRTLALVLRECGHEVDLLYTRVAEGKPIDLGGAFSEYVNSFAGTGIRVVWIDHFGKSDDWLGMSYFSLQYLLQHRYDLVHFDDLFGNGYFPLLARRTGCPALLQTKMCVAIRGSSQWIWDVSRRPVTNLHQLRLMEIERRSIELADAIKAPSAYILEKYAGYGWRTSPNCIVLPNFPTAEYPVARERNRVGADEIVFLGDLETRAGLWIFCHALDRLRWKIKDHRVTFLGRAAIEGGSDTAEVLLRHSTKWPFAVRMLTDFNQDQAIAYLKEAGRVAIIASPEDNASNLLLQCLYQSIPFLACAGGGIQELLEDECRKDVMFAPAVDDLCTKLQEVLEHGAAIARPKFDQRSVRRVFEQWLEPLVKAEVYTAPKPTPAKPILLTVVPSEFPITKVLAQVKRVFDAYKGHIQVEILASKPEVLQARLSSRRGTLPVRVNHIDRFPEISRALAADAPTVVGLCHIAQPISPAWFGRAQTCFAIEKAISALTGMAVDRSGCNQWAPARSSVKVEQKPEKVARYLTGNTPPLFPLAEETNSGFALFRSDVFEKCCDVLPIDAQYDRVKSMQDWIHEILVTLHVSGERFELVPDLLGEQSTDETPFEVFRLEQFMRSLPATLYKYAPGSDRSMLARIAIDWGLERERALAHSKYVSAMSRKIGKDVVHFPLYTPWEQHARQLAMIAHAGGQIDLAIDLGAEVAIQDANKALQPQEYVRAVAEGEVINVVEALSVLRDSLDLTGLNAWGAWDKRQLEIHANVHFEFPSLNLNKTSHFTSIVAVPKNAGGPVRFRIELVSHDEKQHWSEEMIVSADQERLWQFELPQDLRCKCAVRFSTEIADRAESSNQPIALWVNPRFVRLC